MQKLYVLAALVLSGAAWAGGAEGPAFQTFTFSGNPGCSPVVKVVRVGGQPDAGASARVQALFGLDQKDRQGSINWDVVGARDQARREEVGILLAQGRLSRASDFFAAAFIFQHGNCTEHYRVANFLAAQAMKRGHPDAAWIYAASLDRLLMSEGKPQHFGTQYLGDAGGCHMKLYPVDPGTTDAERARYGVPPLGEAEARASQLQAPSCR